MLHRMSPKASDTPDGQILVPLGSAICRIEIIHEWKILFMKTHVKPPPAIFVKVNSKLYLDITSSSLIPLICPRNPSRTPYYFTSHVSFGSSWL